MKNYITNIAYISPILPETLHTFVRFKTARAANIAGLMATPKITPTITLNI